MPRVHNSTVPRCYFCVNEHLFLYLSLHLFMHEKGMSQVPSVCQTRSAPVKLGGKERNKHSIVGGCALDPGATAGGRYRVKAQAAEARKPLQILLMLPRKCKPPCSREKGPSVSTAGWPGALLTICTWLSREEG